MYVLIPCARIPGWGSRQDRIHSEPSQCMEQSPRPGTGRDTDDRSGGVTSRPTETLRYLFGKLRCFVGRNAKDVLLEGLKTQRGIEVYVRLLPKRGNYPVRDYANRIKANGRASGWLPRDNRNCFEIVWSGLRPGLKYKIKPLTAENGRFDSMEECFDRATN